MVGGGLCASMTPSHILRFTGWREHPPDTANRSSKKADEPDAGDAGPPQMHRLAQRITFGEQPHQPPRQCLDDGHLHAQSEVADAAGERLALVKQRTGPDGKAPEAFAESGCARRGTQVFD